jgi:hypothetical protein
MGWTRPIDGRATPSVRFAGSAAQVSAVIPRRSSLRYRLKRRRTDSVDELRAALLPEPGHLCQPGPVMRLSVSSSVAVFYLGRRQHANASRPYTGGKP